jgi:FHS family L-fucose permease-like MFS transporter
MGERLSNVTVSRDTGRSLRGPLVVVTLLFFMWGLITSLNDILVPHFKAAFHLDFRRAQLVQLCFFGAYFVMSYPSGVLVEARGYRPGIITGLVVAGIGCVLFYPAAALGSYAWFLGALFVLASGITLLQVAANPYVTVLGAPASASSRLTLTQAFNSLGTTIGPYVATILILSGGPGTAGGSSLTLVQVPYLVLAATLLLIACLVAVSRLPSRAELDASRERDQAAALAAAKGPRRRSAWAYPHLLLGALAIFVYVGGEVTIGSFLVNFMGQREIAGLTPDVAGKYVSLYWGGAMVGRFIGSAVMLRLAPPKVLAFNAVLAALLVTTAIASGGHAAMWALLAVGLCNSIMFPTIFSLAIEGLGEHTSHGSGVLCMAIVGGAIMPELQAWLADFIGLPLSFVVPLLCYLYIAFYAVKGYRAGQAPVAAGEPGALAP